MPVASATARTRFGIAGWGTRRAGSFAGKTAVVGAPVVVEICLSILRTATIDSNVEQTPAFSGNIVRTVQIDGNRV